MLELFPNEILCEIFVYLDVGERFYSFYNLQSRFNDLLFDRYEIYRVNFRSMIKCEMKFVVEEYLRSIVDRVISLRLSDDHDEGPPQTKLFFSSDLQLNHFIHLRSLTLCYIEKASIFRKILDNCHENRHLTDLKVVKCNSQCMASVDFSNHIWSLSQLVHCRLDMQNDFCIPTLISLSMKSLSISCHNWWIRQTTRLIEQTPSLEHLHIPLNNLNDDPQVILPSFLSITKLKLSNVRSSKVMENLLSSVPNLIYLKVEIFYLNIDGERWKQIIEQYLPELKIFHLRMNVQFRGLNNKEQVEHFFDSFRSEFWLKTHQWFIHYHPQYNEDYSSVFLYTLPDTFHKLDSTLLVDTYRSTRHQDKHFNDELSSNNFFSKILTIQIDLSAKNSFWRNSSMFYCLKSLSVSLLDETNCVDLQSILDRCPCLYELIIEKWSSSQIPLLENRSESIRRLNLGMNQSWNENSFINRQMCHHFVHSSLVQQCEQLLINVENRESILYLIENIVPLRMLNVQYRVLPLSPHRHFISDSSRNERSKDLSMKWLQDRLPSNSIISNFRVNYDNVGMNIYLSKGSTFN